MIYSAPPLSLFHKRTHARIHTCAHMHTYKSLSDSTISFSIPISQDVCVFNQTHICIYMYNHVSVHRSAFTYMRALALVPSCPLTLALSLSPIRSFSDVHLDGEWTRVTNCTSPALSLFLPFSLSLSLALSLTHTHGWQAVQTGRSRRT